MASKVAVRPVAHANRAIGFKPFVSRGFTTMVRQPNKSLFQQPFDRSGTSRIATPLRKLELQKSFRRSYAEQATVIPTAKQAKKRTWGFFRWTWRLIYISALAGIGYTGYGIYLSRNPADQAEPDPQKKTLVVLGRKIANIPDVIIQTRVD